MTDGPSFNCAKSAFSQDFVTPTSALSPVFNEVQLGTRLHDSRSVPGWKEYGAAHLRLRCRSNGLTDPGWGGPDNPCRSPLVHSSPFRIETVTRGQARHGGCTGRP